MIRDTSAQDRVLSSTQARPAWRRWVWPAAGGALLLAGIVFAARGWLAGTTSVDGARLRIAEVTRGDLVRDIAADGRVIDSSGPPPKTEDWVSRRLLPGSTSICRGPSSPARSKAAAPSAPLL